MPAEKNQGMVMAFVSQSLGHQKVHLENQRSAQKINKSASMNQYHKK